MAELINTCCERESLGGGVYRQEISIKPVAYRDGGVLKRINSDWGNSGISARPHIVSASKLMVSIADDGDFRVHPTREAERYFEFGAPLIKVSGNWVRPGFGNRTRTGNRIRWTTDYENAYIVHAGHYLKWGILLKNNFDRWSQFAMSIGTKGLTRKGGQLFADGVPVMRLRAPVVYDYDNEDATRQIAYKFVRQDGQWYALFTLPSLAGMSRPLIDPTLELQPDAAAGKDTHIGSLNADNNFGVTTFATTSNIKNAQIQFDVSSIPATATIDSAIPTLFTNLETANTISLRRTLVEWFEGASDNADPGATDASTWNHRNANSGGPIAWTGGAGGASGTEYAASATATGTPSVDETTEDYGDVKVDVQNWVDDTYTNYGWWTTSNGSDAYKFRTSDHVTPAQRPKLVIVYTMPTRIINLSEANVDGWARGVKIYT